MTIDGRLIAQGNEVSVLRALHRFGWLRTRDVASLVWSRWASRPKEGWPDLVRPACSESGIRMAQRTLKRMREHGLVLSGKGPDGAVLYALAERGARILRDGGIEAATGKDLIRSFSAAHYHHRCVANSCAIAGIQAGFRVSTEREISQGRWLGGSAGVQGKQPDVLLRVAALHWWLEVERSRKNARDYEHLLSWLMLAIPEAVHGQSGELLGASRRLAGVYFVCRPNFEKKLTEDLIARGLKKEDIDFAIRFETCLYKLEAIAFY